MARGTDRHDESGVDGLGALIADELEDQGRTRSERRRRKKRQRRRPFVIVLSLLITAAVLVFGIFFARDIIDRFSNVPDYTGSGEETVQVRVDPGDSLSDIAQKLADADVVKSAKAFTEAAAENDAAKSIQPGLYQLKTKMKASEALALMLQPDSSLTTKVTVVEGLTVDQTLAALSEATGLPVADFEAALADRANLGLPAWVPADAPVLEGMLMPGTYDFDPEDTALGILQTLVANFNQVAGNLGLEQKAAAIGQSPYDVIKIASLIEREAMHDDERAKVARVIYNRLAVPMVLQIDASTAYGAGKSGTELTSADLQDTSNPYNLYVVKGLPPTPISGVGEASINAALAPADGTWIYYVRNSEDGHHAFVTTYDEFLAAKAVCQQNGWC